MDQNRYKHPFFCWFRNGSQKTKLKTWQRVIWLTEQVTPYKCQGRRQARWKVSPSGLCLGLNLYIVLIMYKIQYLLKQKKRPVLDITGFVFRMSIQVKVEVRSTKTFTLVPLRKKNPVRSNMVSFFCINSNVSNLYNNDAIIYKINKKVVRTVLLVNEFTKLSYYNIGQILKLVHKMNCKSIKRCNIGMYHRPLTDIIRRIYDIIAGSIIVRVLLSKIKVSSV